jgi:alanyl-tRNA synthetase
MGGQVADHGDILIPGETPCRFHVTDVQKNKGGKYMHYGKMIEGILKLGDTVTAAIDTERRQAVARAHSATHLLDKALRTVLGDHVHQAGSLVEPDRVRFDFTHFSAMTAEEVKQVSDLVNDAILAGYAVRTDVLPIEEARKRGAIALFGEKYGDTVRVVRMKDEHNADYSMEFCGGTHVANTAMVGAFHIKSEGSVASGVRRIEATTGRESLQSMTDLEREMEEVSSLLKAKPAELLSRVEAQLNEIRELRKTVSAYQDRELVSEAANYLSGAKTVGSAKVLTVSLTDVSADALRKIGDFLRDKEENVVAVLSSVSGEKLTFLAVCGKAAVKSGIKAGDIIKHVTKLCGGSGGGKPDSAMGGGKDLSKLEEALSSVDQLVVEKLGL